MVLPGSTMPPCTIGTGMNIGSIGAGKYVEPGYETLGAYYTVNDFINYTINVSTSMLAGRVNLTANTGIRQNNLNNMADSNQRDAISSVAVGIIPTESLMFNLSYSNFYNYTHVRPLIDELVAQTEYELMDTLRFTQINENINLGANWRIVETETISHGLMLNLGFQQATQTQNSAVENAGSRFMNGSGGYQYGLKDLNLNFALNVNYSRNKSPESIMESLGPNLSVRKSFPERNLSGNFSLGWNGTYTDGTNNGSITTTRLNISYKLKEVHQFGFSTAYNHRNYNASKSQQATATLNSAIVSAGLNRKILTKTTFDDEEALHLFSPCAFSASVHYGTDALPHTYQHHSNPSCAFFLGWFC